MKTKKRILSVILAAMMMLALTACGGMTTDDAKTYVQSVLDASYKADFSEYTEQTDSTEEEAQQLFDENLDNIMSMGGFTDAGLSEELSASYRQLFQDMLAQAKYEVGSATEGEDDGFVVEVSAEQLRRRWRTSLTSLSSQARMRSTRWSSRRCTTSWCRGWQNPPTGRLRQWRYMWS